MGNPKVYDQDGQERDWAWFVEQFGPITVEQPPVTGGKVFRVVKLRDSEGPSVQLVGVRDADRMPVIGANVVRFWPGAPKLPDWGDPASRWRPRGVMGPTNAEGNIGFGMGHGDFYFTPNCGSSAVWVADQHGPSDLVVGLGMLGGTNHRHVDVFYQLIDLNQQPPDDEPDKPPDDEPDKPPDDEPNQPPAADEQWQALLGKLDRIIELLETQAQSQPRSPGQTQ